MRPSPSGGSRLTKSAAAAPARCTTPCEHSMPQSGTCPGSCERNERRIGRGAQPETSLGDLGPTASATLESRPTCKPTKQQLLGSHTPASCCHTRGWGAHSLQQYAASLQREQSLRSVPRVPHLQHIAASPIAAASGVRSLGSRHDCLCPPHAAFWHLLGVRISAGGHPTRTRKEGRRVGDWGAALTPCRSTPPPCTACTS